MLCLVKCMADITVTFLPRPPVGPKVASDCSASDSKNTHSRSISVDRGGMTYLQGPFLSLLSLVHPGQWAQDCQSESIHERLEKALFRTGDQH